MLVDEYDKPILDVLHDPDLARANRDYLRGFYGIIKGSARHVRFVFVTGVSMFSKVSLFSGLNNLKDISLDPRYATICGYRNEDLDRVFAPELDGLDRDEIRAWYAGYRWRGEEPVYNPYDVLLLLDSREFRPWWFETGSPEFLFRLLMEQSVSPLELEGRLAGMDLVSKFDVDDIGIEALLFQTGYLTITGEERQGHRTLYRLDYPNREVRLSLNDGLLAWLGQKGVEPLERGREFCALLEAHDFAGFGATLRAWLAGIPYQWHATGDLARYEAWYASLLYMCLRTIGADLRGEEASARGRADMVLRLGRQVFVIEFKMAETDDGGEAALDAGDGTDARTRLCGEIPRPRRAGPSGRRGLRTRGAQPPRHPRRTCMSDGQAGGSTAPLSNPLVRELGGHSGRFPRLPWTFQLISLSHQDGA